MKKKCLRLSLILALPVFVFCGCFTDTYPGDRVREAIADICRTEYGIEQIEVKSAGSTVGVYLPMDRLFAADFKEVFQSGEVGDLEKLFEPSPEAFDRIENVLFSISRVLLSTSKEFQFYVLTASDVKQTGQQISIIGSVNDIRRVRIWDISKGEYRRRIVTDWEYNPLALWHQPVRQFFKDVETLSADAVRGRYFDDEVSEEVIQNLFLNRLPAVPEKSPETRWEFLELKSLPIQPNERIVLAKVRPFSAVKGKKTQQAGPVLRYLLLVVLRSELPQLERVIPFQFLDTEGNLKVVELPDDLEFDEKDPNWEEEFRFTEVTMGSFLARQLTRRAHMTLTEDERIRYTFEDLKLDFQYDDSSVPAYFTLNIDAQLKDSGTVRDAAGVYHEDMMYLLRMILTDFAGVVRSYGFTEFEYLRVDGVRESSAKMLSRSNIERYYQKKMTIEELVSAR